MYKSLLKLIITQYDYIFTNPVFVVNLLGDDSATYALCVLRFQNHLSRFKMHECAFSRFMYD